MSAEITLKAGDLSVLLRGVSAEVLEAIALPILKERGWTFEKSTRRETPTQLFTRLGISHATLARRLSDPLCPDVVIDHCRPGPDNRDKQKPRIRFIHSNKILDAFLTAGTRAELRNNS